MKRTHMIKDVEAIVLENWYDWCMENTNIRVDLIGIYTSVEQKDSYVKRDFLLSLNYISLLYL